MAVEFGKWEKIEREDSKKNPPAGIFFMKGWWTNHRDEPIKRAIYGQKLRFHIQMNKNFAQVGDIVYFGLYDCDRFAFGKDTVKKDDDPIPLEYKETKKPYEWAKVDKDYKVVLEFRLTTELMANWSKLDQDGVFELYFRCSYNNRGKKEHCALPFDKEDYLRLGTIVIDRYKMPGLNPEGTGIAEDMAYGFGRPNSESKQIYTQDEIIQYIKEYTEGGFDINSQYEFANAGPHIEYLTEIEVTAKHNSNSKEKENNIPLRVAIDKTYVAKPKILTTENVEKVKELNKKAIYSKEKCYNTFYRPEIKISNNLRIKLPKISTGLDVRIFDNFSNEVLFWDFENTAELYFARGKLQENLERMIAKFRRNEGGIYEDEVLTRGVLGRDETADYCLKVEDYIAEQMKKNFSKLEDVEDKEPYFLVGKSYENNKGKRKDLGKTFDKPTYSYTPLYLAPIKATDGLTISLNDIWGTEVILKELNFTDSKNYYAKYNVTLWDHFGLDIPDMEKIFNIIPSVGETFVCWFILQHLRGYKPFLTKITFEKEFKASL